MKLLSILKKTGQEKDDTMNCLLCGVKPARVDTLKKGGGNKCPDEENVDEDEDDEQEEEACEDGIYKSIDIQPAAKRQRRRLCSLEKCCAKGCQKVHFWWKK